MSPDDASQKLNYRAVGVDIEAGQRLVERVRGIAASTHRPGVLGEIGSFGGLFDLAALDYRHPVLVSATDGVGSKLSLALEANARMGIGIDLVAMCANDVLAQGAQPLFFLDYIGCGKLRVDEVAELVSGIADGCRLAGAALIGGETAELPGLCAQTGYELAGFCVGVVERDQLIDGSRIRAQDRLVGIASSGVHANGYSLVRRILKQCSPPATEQRLQTLLTPTRIYVPAVLELLRQQEVHGIAHITGGGLPENLARILPSGLGAVIEEDSWKQPEIFRWLQQQGRIAETEMYRVFNCGVGMVLCLARQHAEAAIRCLEQAGERAWILGRVEPVPATAPSSDRIQFQ